MKTQREGGGSDRNDKQTGENTTTIGFRFDGIGIGAGDGAASVANAGGGSGRSKKKVLNTPPTHASASASTATVLTAAYDSVINAISNIIDPLLKYELALFVRDYYNRKVEGTVGVPDNVETIPESVAETTAEAAGEISEEVAKKFLKKSLHHQC